MTKTNPATAVMNLTVHTSVRRAIKIRALDRDITIAACVHELLCTALGIKDLANPFVEKAEVTPVKRPARAR